MRVDPIDATDGPAASSRQGRTARTSWLRLALALIVSVAVLSAPLATRPSAAETASSFPGWEAITDIHYNPAEESNLGTYLASGAADLAAQLNLLRPVPFKVTTTAPSGAAVRLAVRPALADFEGRNDDAFKLTTDAGGLSITGKSALAVRHGIYTVLDDLGFRWFFVNEAWNVVPTTLSPVSYRGDVQAPAYRQRTLGTPMSFLQGTDDGPDIMRKWRMRNRLDSNEDFAAHHSYNQISPLQQTATEYPNAVCYDVDGRPRNLRPDAPIVVERAKDFGSRYFNVPIVGQQVKMAAPINPEDGAQRCANWLNGDGTLNTQIVTDKVFGLANTTAKDLQTTRPGKYAGVMSYNVYSEVPTMPLEANLYVQVATDFATVGTKLSFQERLAGFRAKGVMTGVYDYLNVWQYTHDRPYGPGAMKAKLSSLPVGAANGATTYRAEAGDNWGAKGRAYWLASKLGWAPTADQDALLADFYAKAFGPAEEPMKQFFTRMDTQVVTDRTRGLGFRDLDEALRLAAAAGDAQVEERVRQMVLFTYYDWRWTNGITDGYKLSLEEMKALYGFAWRLTNLHLITVTPEKGVVRGKLRKQFGLTDADLAPLENKTPPSPAEVRSFLDEALNRWKGQTLIDARPIDPAGLNLAAGAAIDSTAKTSATYGGWENASILVPAGANQSVRATVTCSCVNGMPITWMDPNKAVVTRKNVVNCKAGCTFSLPTTAAGRYRLLVPNPVMKVKLDRPAAHDLSQNANMGGDLEGLVRFAASGYFDVPAGTPSMVVGTGAGDLTLTDPSGQTRVLNRSEFGVTNPQPGLWRMSIKATTKPRPIWLLGVPPLVWNDPSQLLRAS